MIPGLWALCFVSLGFLAGLLYVSPVKSRKRTVFLARDAQVLAGRVEIMPRIDYQTTKYGFGGFLIGQNMDILIDGEPVPRVTRFILTIEPDKAVTFDLTALP